MLHASLKHSWTRVAMAVVGELIYAVGVNLFIIPLHLYTGGLLGMCQLLRTLIYQALNITNGYDFSALLYYVMNIPIFLIAFRALGRVFLRNSIICTTACTLFLSLVPIPSAPMLEDVLTNCLLGGALAGLGCGIVLTCGCSGGGLEVLGLYFSKKGARFTLGKFNIAFNAVLYGLCGILFSVQTMIYSILYTIFCAVVLDRVHQQSINVQALIFTKDHGAELSQYIMETLHRGVTWWDGQGAYTGQNVKILCVCLSKYEINDLREVMHQVDPHAFYIVQEGVQVSDNFIRRLSE